MTRRLDFMRRETILTADGRVQLERLRVVACSRFGVYLHRIVLPDDGRDPHDHAWPFLSWVLRGGYVEQVHFALWDINAWQTYARRRWSWHRMATDRAHRITHVEPGTVTLLFRGLRGRDWGFWTAAGRVLHGEYPTTGERV